VGPRGPKVSQNGRDGVHGKNERKRGENDRQKKRVNSNKKWCKRGAREGSLVCIMIEVEMGGRSEALT